MLSVISCIEKILYKQHIHIFSKNIIAPLTNLNYLCKKKNWSVFSRAFLKLISL